MSQPSRPRAKATAKRRRQLKPDVPTPLESRCLLAPVVTTYPTVATFTAADTPTNQFLGTVIVAADTTATTLQTAAPITSVTELTPSSSFGGDIVRVKVLEVDVPRKRISLTLRLDDELGGKPDRTQSAPRNTGRMSSSAPRSAGPASSGGGALADALRRAAEKNGNSRGK